MAFEIIKLEPPYACEGEVVVATVSQDLENPLVMVDNFPADEIRLENGRTVSFKIPRTPIMPSDDQRDKGKEKDIGGIGGTYHVVINDFKKGEAWAQLKVLGSDIFYIDKKGQEKTGQQVFIMLIAQDASEEDLRDKIESVAGKESLVSFQSKLLVDQGSKSLREGWLGDARFATVRIRGDREKIGSNLHNLRIKFGLDVEGVGSLQHEQNSYSIALSQKRNGLPVWSISPDIIRRCAVHGGYHVGPLDDPEYFCPGWLSNFEERSLTPALSSVEVNDVIVAVLDSAKSKTDDDFVFVVDPNDPFIKNPNYPSDCGGFLPLPPHPLVRGHGVPIGNAIQTVANVKNIIYKKLVVKRLNHFGKEEYVFLDSQIVPAIYEVLSEAQDHFGPNSRLNVVFNMSFCSFESDSVLRGVLMDAARQGALFAAAAGNWEVMRRERLKLYKEQFKKKHESLLPPGKIRQLLDRFERQVIQARVYPAAYDIPEVVGVGALQKWKAPNDKWERAPWSMKGDWVNVCAIGCQLKLKGPDGNDHLYQGTSFATPIVAAALALLRSRNPHLPTAEVVKCLIDQARSNRVLLPLPPLGVGQDSDEEYGAGPVIPERMIFDCK